MWRLCTSLLISEKLPGCIISPFKCLQKLEPYFSDIAPFLSAPNFEETLMVVIKHRGSAETAISGVIKTIDSIANHSYFLLAKWSP
jgi:hypothetical protein